MQTEEEQRMNELLDELFDSVSEALRYLEGIRRDVGRGEYDLSRIEGDIDYMEARFSVGSVMNELLELRNKLTNSSVDVWEHFAKGTNA
jgi:hypothetical protein